MQQVKIIVSVMFLLHFLGNSLQLIEQYYQKISILIKVNNNVEKLIPLLSKFNFWWDNQLPFLRFGRILDLVFNGTFWISVMDSFLFSDHLIVFFIKICPLPCIWSQMEGLKNFTVISISQIFSLFMKAISQSECSNYSLL